MSTSAINTNNTASAGSSNTAAAQSALNGTLNDFLKLLTVQLQNQDPTDPADTNDITQQIASLSQVEQQINTNTNLQNLIAMFSSNQVSTAVSYIGKQVDAEGNQSVLAEGGAIFVYDLPSAADNVTVSVLDSTGAVVYSGEASKKAGRNEILWDGTTNAGSAAPDGVYSFKVSAKNSNNETIAATTYTTGLVSSVDTKDGATSLSLGLGLSIPLKEVISVRAIGNVVPEESEG